MDKVESYRDLRVWQLGMDLVEQCYIVTRKFPNDEQFGLTSQIRRAAVSIPANIAEGWGRQGRAEYLRFLMIAQGSLKELETHLLLSRRVGITNESQVEPLLKNADSLGRMIFNLARKLRQKNSDT